jgi:hypothetical protein
MPEISNRRDCSQSEINFLRQYLSKTPVANSIELINLGAKVSKGQIKGSSKIGELETIWSRLDTIRSSYEYGIVKFRVNQVIHVLNRYSSYCSKKPLQEIKAIKESLEKNKGKLADPTITLQEINNNLRIIDGCHRTVAFYEYYSEKGVYDVSLSVNLITTS